VFTTALWTRKARELIENPHVSLLFHWPALGRQAHVAGNAEVAERELAEELFAQRPVLHQLQAYVSRQGEAIDGLDDLRVRMSGSQAKPVPCPPDWGAVRLVPEAVELWQSAADRLHDRRLFERGAGGWALKRLAP